jgi:hypothetical protein
LDANFILMIPTSHGINPKSWERMPMPLHKSDDEADLGFLVWSGEFLSKDRLINQL